MKQINKSKMYIEFKKESPGHFVWKGLQSNTVTKNPIFHNLN